MNKAKNPSSILYWNDLENDAQLKTCSLAAKGLWDHHMLPIAARSAEPGVVLLGNHPSRLDGDLPTLLARSVGEMPETIAALLRELIDSGAASVDAKGRVYNRRMVREEGIRKARAEAGRRGGTAPKTKKANPQQTSSEGPSKDGSKHSDGQATASVGAETIIPAKLAADGKQTPKRAGSKIEPSSDFMLQSSSDVTTTSSSEAAASPTAAREAAAAADDDLAIPPFLRRSADGPQAAVVSRELVDEAFALWTPVAYELRIPDVGHLNRDRRAALAERLHEIGGIEGWKLFLEKVREAEFLREPDGRPKFWVGLPKLLEPEHFSKVLEGRYAERHEAQREPDRGAPTVADGVAAAFSRRFVQAGG